MWCVQKITVFCSYRALKLSFTTASIFSLFYGHRVTIFTAIFIKILLLFKFYCERLLALYVSMVTSEINSQLLQIK